MQSYIVVEAIHLVHHVAPCLTNGRGTDVGSGVNAFLGAAHAVKWGPVALMNFESGLEALVDPFADSRWRALTGFETRKPRRQVMRYSRPCATWLSRFRRSFSASSQGLQSRIVVLLRSDKRNSVGDIDRCCRKTFAKRSPFPNPAWRAILSAGNSVSANS